MTTAADINNALAQLVADGARLQAIVNGSNTTDVTLQDGTTLVPSISKLFAGISNQWRTPVRVATTGALPNTPTYANGTAGLGATLTAGSNGALTIDNRAVSAGDRVLVKDQAAQLQNGIYTVTNAGSGAAAYVLTRAVDANTSANFVVGMATSVIDGDANTGLIVVVATPLSGTITVGTTAVVFKSQPNALTSADLAGVDQNITQDVSAAYTITNADGGKLLALGGAALYTVTFNAASTYLPKLRTTLFNVDTLRWKLVAVPGAGNYWLAPGQQITVRNVDNAWKVTELGAWRTNANITLYFSESAGSVNNDGMTSASPLTFAEAQKRMRNLIDLNGNTAILQANDGTYTTFGTIAAHWRGLHVVGIMGNAANNQLTQFVVPNATDGIYVKDYACVQIQYFYFTGGSAARAVVAEQFAIADIGNCLFGGFGANSSGIVALGYGSIGAIGVLSFAGNLDFPLVATGGKIGLGPFVHQITQALTVNTFALPTLAGRIIADPGNGWGGAGVASVIGTKYNAVGCAIISTSGVAFPGGTAGTKDSTSYVS